MARAPREASSSSWSLPLTSQDHSDGAALATGAKSQLPQLHVAVFSMDPLQHMQGWLAPDLRCYQRPLLSLIAGFHARSCKGLTAARRRIEVRQSCCHTRHRSVGTLKYH